MSSNENSGVAVRVIRSAKRKRTVQARLVDGVLEVRIPSWMSAKEEAKAVADMQAKVARKHTSTRRSDADLHERAVQLKKASSTGERRSAQFVGWAIKTHGGAAALPLPATFASPIASRTYQSMSLILSSSMS